MANAEQILVPVHVGLREPSFAPPVLGAEAGGGVVRRMAAPRDIPLVQQGFDWGSHGVTPRWIGMESSDCPAAVEPHNFHQQGADELARFFAGAAERAETAVLICTMGNVNDDRPRPLMARGDATVSIADTEEYILGARTPRGSAISLAPGLTGADRDLGLRLISRGADAPWWGMSLMGSQIATGMGVGPPAQIVGTLAPIVLDAAGQPVVAVWVSPSGDRRWYVVPDQSDWGSLLDWLTAQVLPELTPEIMRRLRSPHLRDPDLMTAAESEARTALNALEDEYARRREALQIDLDAAQAAADPIRDGLLYGTAKPLESAVATVLTDAGITVAELDVALGDTSSADLLAELDGRRRLIEIKSASGSAPESLMTQLENHLRNWPPPGQPPVEGGVLIVNHQHRQPPAQRDAAVYGRTDFLRNLQAPVLPTRRLFDWWRAGAWEQIRGAIFPATDGRTPTTPAPLPPDPPSVGRSTHDGRRRPWPDRCHSG